MAVLTCGRCGHLNPQGAQYCEACWTALQTGVALDARRTTLTMSIASTEDRPAANYQVKQRAHIGKLASHAIALYIDDDPKPLVVSILGQVALGRAVPSDAQECVDLTPYGAKEKGVSRHHCALKRMGGALLVQDMGSSNGTWLDGVRLPIFQPTVVVSGSRLRLGRMELQIFLPE